MKCVEGKGVYETEEAANAAIKFLSTDLPKRFRPRHLHAYQCTKCKKWHLTSRKNDF